MVIEQIYTGCLAEAAYYIHSKGEGVIIDPLRETEPYVSRAKKDGVKIKYVFLTHFHADFVSGHVDLANKTGATIVFGPNAKAEFNFYSAKDNEIFNVGDVSFQLLHTPGHTLESSTYLLTNPKGDKHCIFTGDTLFIGDVGRPDLAVKSDLSDKDLAGLLFDSLRNKIMTLPDNLIVYPAHGAGSACGKNMSKETFDSLGNQKIVNYALRSDMMKNEFIKELISDIAAPPQYFPKNVKMNQSLNPDFDSILNKGINPLDASDFQEMIQNENIIVLDCRTPIEFAKGHIPNSIFIGLDGAFAPWVGTLINDINQAMILVVPENRESEAVTRLARTGYDNSIGFLKGGILSWINAGFETAQIQSILPAELERQSKNNINIIDVRKNNEYDTEHIIGSQNIPLEFIYDNLNSYDPEETYFIHCQGGYRSMIASSILKSKGINNLIDVSGGFKLIKEKTNLKLSEFKCPTTVN